MRIHPFLFISAIVVAYKRGTMPSWKLHSFRRADTIQKSEFRDRRLCASPNSIDARLSPVYKFSSPFSSHLPCLWTDRTKAVVKQNRRTASWIVNINSSYRDTTPVNDPLVSFRSSFFIMSRSTSSFVQKKYPRLFESAMINVIFISYNTKPFVILWI